MTYALVISVIVALAVGIVMAPLVPLMMVKAAMVLHWWMMVCLGAFPVATPAPTPVVQHIQRQIIYEVPPCGCPENKAVVVQTKEVYYTPQLM